MLFVLFKKKKKVAEIIKDIEPVQHTHSHVGVEKTRVSSASYILFIHAVVGEEVELQCTDVGRLY